MASQDAPPATSRAATATAPARSTTAPERSLSATARLRDSSSSANSDATRKNLLKHSSAAWGGCGTSNARGRTRTWTRTWIAEWAATYPPADARHALCAGAWARAPGARAPARARHAPSAYQCQSAGPRTRARRTPIRRSARARRCWCALCACANVCAHARCQAVLGRVGALRGRGGRGCLQGRGLAQERGQGIEDEGAGLGRRAVEVGAANPAAAPRLLPALDACETPGGPICNGFGPKFGQTRHETWTNSAQDRPHTYPRPTPDFPQTYCNIYPTYPQERAQINSRSAQE